MRNWFFPSLIFIFFLLQGTILNSFRILGVKPDFLLIGAVTASLVFEWKWAFVLSIFCGFLKDTLGINLFGWHTFLFPLWSLIIIKLSKKLSIDNNFMRAGLISIIVIFNSLITQLTFFSSGKPMLSFGMFLRIALLESLYTALSLFLLFKITTKTILNIS